MTFRSGINYKIHKIAFIRNPLDIYYSQFERFRNYHFEEQVVKQKIIDFFEFIDMEHEKNDLFIMKYEDFCTAQYARIRMINYIDFANDLNKDIDLTFIHNGVIPKWMLYPYERNMQLANLFKPYLIKYGYEFKEKEMKTSFNIKVKQRYKKIKTEIRILNMIFSGYDTAEGMYFRHNFSFFARWYRNILLLIPAKRKIFNEYFQKHNKGTLKESIKRNIYRIVFQYPRIYLSRIIDKLTS